MKQKIKIAIVEDNTTARLNLRSNLLSMGEFDIASYTNGKELRNGLRTMNFDVVVIDFHLGQNKNGVEWIQYLTEAKLIKPSTGIVFLTSDRLPQTISQILDIHPDILIIKPYTIKTLHTSMNHYLSIRSKIKPALEYLDNEQPEKALKFVDDSLQGSLSKRARADFIKLKGRLLISEQRYTDAVALYRNILERSSNVLWAHWGLIKSEFLSGQWRHCQNMLDSLISDQLTKDKAYEWMACVEIGKENYDLAEKILDNIKENDLTIPATKLKVLAYKMQGRSEEAIKLLEKKRQSNFTVKERFDEYTIELARYHLQLAENSVMNERAPKLHAAKCLIGNASRSILDNQTQHQRDFMLALASLLEGDKQKAERIILDKTVGDAKNAKLTTMVDAIKVWFGLGKEDKAREVWNEVDRKLSAKDDQIDQILAGSLMLETEKSLGLSEEKAKRVNDQGMVLYLGNQLNDAIELFYKARQLDSSVPAFTLNLLQCLSDIKKAEYKDQKTLVLVDELKDKRLSESNKKRYNLIRKKINEFPEAYRMSDYEEHMSEDVA
ncbi:MAG: DNA-binding NarL/FixJ family response regulator [Bermanella sp.]|jgi:DNA-binding NarL/FixJ family response regulator|uniref:response regulator n=1 Tax=Glaciecola sp. 33A TaxID=2057807 RepID=UPI001E2A1D01|nr:response regulator [Glaciecola sp. 33A]